MKDLVGLPGNGGSWTELIRPLSAVGPDDDLESILLSFQREATTLCLVQEGESPLGLVTIEDVLEQVVGRIEDEYPRHPQINLDDIALVDDALLDLSSREADAAIQEMAQRIPAARLPAGTDVAALAIARERELPTNVGFGVAIPHARCPRLATPLVVFGRSSEGVIFDPQSTELVHLVFLLVSPAEQPDVQVLLLSKLATIAGNPELRRRLSEATSAMEFRAVLAETAPESLPVD
ncbi:MAG: PTS sugar transporter subunit IIA [Pirellulales bacterium]